MAGKHTRLWQQRGAMATRLGMKAKTILHANNRQAYLIGGRGKESLYPAGVGSSVALGLMQIFASENSHDCIVCGRDSRCFLKEIGY